jgi:flagellar biosynthesis protein FlhA
VIVFAILLVVNFVVITKGSGRIAEVAARFTLDSMPGKQMAIDADLSSGLIDRDRGQEAPQGAGAGIDLLRGHGRRQQVRARRRRRRPDHHRHQHHRRHPDRGDAAQDADRPGASTYTIMTIGDGLVSQIPALVISIAAGFLVSKAGVEGSADKALVTQLA